MKKTKLEKLQTELDAARRHGQLLLLVMLIKMKANLRITDDTFWIDCSEKAPRAGIETIKMIADEFIPGVLMEHPFSSIFFIEGAQFG